MSWNAAAGELWRRTKQDIERHLTGLAVASYLAKYATKGTEPAGHASARITPDTVDIYANPAGTHTERLIHACWTLGQAEGRMCGKATWTSLRRWAHMLGG